MDSHNLDENKTEMFAMLGRIVWICARIESDLRTIIAVQERILDPDKAAKTLAHLPAQKLLERAAQFIEASDLKESKSDAEYLRSIAWVFGERNSYVHGLHYTGKNWWRVRIKRKPPRISESEITLQDMKEFYIHLKNIDEELGAMEFFRGLMPDGFGFQRY